MKIKHLIPVLITLLVLGTVGVTSLQASPGIRRTKVASIVNERVLAVNEKLLKVDPERLKEMVPEQSVVEKELEAIPIPRRFLLWTHNGKNIMWGTYGNGYFRGQDNHGEYVWGIYGRGVFAGFYDGEFFFGYYRRGFWKATGLFGLETAHGRYVTFPSVYPVPMAIEEAG